MLFKFLFRNLKGYRLLVVLAILVTFTQVNADILAGLPIKFITSKIQNPGSDPTCTVPFLDGILSRFDTPLLDSSLRTTSATSSVPPISPCPPSASKTPHWLLYFPLPSPPPTTHHSLIGVVVFSMILLLLLGILSGILTYVDLFLASYTAQHLTARLRSQLFEHLQRLSLDWHGKQKKGDLVQRVTGNIVDIEKLVTDGLVDLLAASLTLTGVGLVMYEVSPSYALISLAIIPALVVIVLVYTKSIKAATKKAAKAEGQVSGVANEDINALTVIKVFTREEREDLRFGRYVTERRKAGLRAGGLQAQFVPIVTILTVLGTSIIIGVGGYVAAGNSFPFGPFNVPAGAVDIGTLVLFLLYLKMFYQPIRDLSKLANLASSAGSGAERIQDIFDQAPEVLESAAPYYGPKKLRGEITFDNVTFGYTKDRLVLKGINLHIPAGRKVALVGLSGGGKTTLVKLIPRFYEITDGSLRIDGADNRMYPLGVLRQNVSMVLQDSVLFEGTVRDNIEIGRPGAEETEIVEAAKQAQIHETIMDMPDGYDSLVREQGKNFSGGQRQRLAIARAILRDGPILILDEPTASLDVEAEAEVMHALDKLIVGRTVLMISHRLSTLGNVDEIIVLKDGRIIEQGSYKDLKQKNGVFASLLEEQNRYNVEKAGDKSIIVSAFAKIPPAHEVPPQPAPIHQVPTRVDPPLPKTRSLGDSCVQIELDGRPIGERQLNKPILTVGRLSGNDIQIPNQRVSRLHAKIQLENGAWVIEDADSVNGLVYQGNRIERHTLSDGDNIYIAPTAVLHYKVTQ